MLIAAMIALWPQAKFKRLSSEKSMMEILVMLIFTDKVGDKKEHKISYFNKFQISEEHRKNHICV